MPLLYVSKGNQERNKRYTAHQMHSVLALLPYTRLLVVGVPDSEYLSFSQYPAYPRAE